MSSYKQGQIVLVPVPFPSNPAETKPRPALIASTNRYNEREDYIVVAVTSNVAAAVDGDIKITGKEVQECGLLRESLVKVGVLFTVNASRITKAIGTMPRALFNRVITGIITNFRE
jgi:mRNA-degrading endonuclease toxin of MazEF toxin-antitoxin module